MNIIEIVGFITGVLGIYLTLKEKIWCFPIGIINVLLSMVLFFSQNLYADALQQIVYLILLIYGWLKWFSNTKDKEIKISKLYIREIVFLLIIACFTSLLLGYILAQYTDASFPWLDSSATSISFVAQWIIAKKKIENWIFWMIVNITYIGIYLNKNLYLYSLLFLVYFILAIWGYLEWKKQLDTYEKTV